MKDFFKYMIRPMAIFSGIPSLGLLIYYLTHRKNLLAIVLILYFVLVTGSVIKYFFNTSSDKFNKYSK